MIYQDALSSFNPNKKCRNQFIEILKLNSAISNYEIENIISNSIKTVKINGKKLNSYPHQLSGGELQRIAIAMALASNAELIICDEPTTNLDPKLKKDITELIREINRERGTTFLIISHDREFIRNLSSNTYQLAANIFNKCEIDSPEFIKKFPQKKASNALNNDTILEVHNLNKIFRSNFSIRHFHYLKNTVALENVSIKLKKGQILGLLGDSGSGKSTLARILVNLETPDSGKIIFENKTGFTKNKKEIFKSIQLVFQNPLTSLNRIIKIKNLITEAISISGLQKSNSEIKTIVADFGIKEELLERYPDQISGGEAQRIALVRALCLNPKILILDESLSSLDQTSQIEIMNLILDHQKIHNTSIVLITHDHNLANAYCDEVITMSEGRVI